MEVMRMEEKLILAPNGYISASQNCGVVWSMNAPRSRSLPLSCNMLPVA